MDTAKHDEEEIQGTGNWTKATKNEGKEELEVNKTERSKDKIHAVVVLTIREGIPPSK